MPAENKPRKKLLRRTLLCDVVLILGISLLGLGALEGGVRLAHRLGDGTWGATEMSRFYREQLAVRSLYRRHPYLNTAPREGAQTQAFGKRASFNSLGYRSPERSRQKPPGTYRILCAGGSTTFDLLAADDASSWPWRLEAELRTASGAAVEVWNAGFPGWTSLENLISLAIRDVDLQPDLVVLYQGINDLQPASQQPFDRQYEARAGLQRLALGFELPPLPWYERSLLLEKLRHLVAGTVSPEDRIWGAMAAAGPRQREIPQAAVDAFARNVRSLLAVARAHGARVVLVTQPLRLRQRHAALDRKYLAGWIPGLEPESVAGQLGRLNDVLRRLGAEEGGLLIDAARGGGWRDQDFSDPMHLSPQGSDKLIRLLAPALRRELARQEEKTAPAATPQTPPS